MDWVIDGQSLVSLFAWKCHQVLIQTVPCSLNQLMALAAAICGVITRVSSRLAQYSRP